MSLDERTEAQPDEVTGGGGQLAGRRLRWLGAGIIGAAAVFALLTIGIRVLVPDIPAQPLSSGNHLGMGSTQPVVTFDIVSERTDIALFKQGAPMTVATSIRN